MAILANLCMKASSNPSLKTYISLLPCPTPDGTSSALEISAQKKKELVCLHCVKNSTPAVVLYFVSIFCFICEYLKHNKLVMNLILLKVDWTFQYWLIGYSSCAIMLFLIEFKCKLKGLLKS